MSKLVWDKLGDRRYQTGLDRGVLYLPNGSAVVWNGLTSVIEDFDQESAPVYYDGMKISDFMMLGDFSATMKAITYPDQFVEFEGTTDVREGFYLGNQRPKSFGLCYRTGLLNDLDGEIGHKIHLIYNAIAIPNSKAYESLTDSTNITEFEWNITAIPEDVLGYRPTAHVIINSVDIDPMLKQALEDILYGSNNVSATLIPMSDLITLVKNWAGGVDPGSGLRILDHGDGTWTATSSVAEDITFPFTDIDEFEINNVYSVYLNPSEYTISDQPIIIDPPPSDATISIVDRGDGTWSATTLDPLLITVDINGQFTILNANVVAIGLDSFQISDTV